MNDLILLAIPAEAPDLAHMPNVFFTGVGKVNAALTVATLIERYQPTRIFNFGTAGGITASGLVQCTQFVQRDMSCAPLGCAAGQTPYETEHYIGSTAGATCSTGDSFVTDPVLELPADVVDMEAYALAKACHNSNIEFVCYKYVSDQADNNASVEWQQQVSAGQSHYINVLKQYSIIQD